LYSGEKEGYDGRIVFEETVKKKFGDGKAIFYYELDEAKSELSYFGRDGKEADRDRYTNVVGWVIELGQRSIKINPEIKFKLMQERDFKGNIVREYGIVNGEELIKIQYEDRGLFIIDKELLGEDRGGAFIVEQKPDGNFAVIDIVKGMPDEFRFPARIQSSYEIDYNNPGQFKTSWRKLINIITNDSDSPLVYFDNVPKPDRDEEIKGSRIDVINSAGEIIGSSFQFFKGKPTPIMTVRNFTIRDGMVIPNNGFVDIEVEQHGLPLSLRFDLDRTKATGLLTPVAMSDYYIEEGTDSIVINFNQRIAFIERRDKTYRYITGLAHIRPTANIVIDGRELGDIFDPTHLENALSFTRMVKLENNQLVSKATGKPVQGLTIERLMDFYYRLEDVPEEHAKDLQQIYPSALLRALEIPLVTVTTYVTSNGTSDVSVGILRRIGFERAYVESKNTGIIYEKGTDTRLGTNVRGIYRNLYGYIFVQKEQDQTATYISKFNKYGEGQISLRTGIHKDENGNDKVMIDSVTFYLGEYPQTNMFAFLRLEGKFRAQKDGEIVVLGDDLLANHDALEDATVYVEDSFLKPISIELKDGEGRRRLILADYRGNLSELMGAQIDIASWAKDKKLDKLVDEMHEVTFLIYSREIETSYDAGVLNLGFEEESYTYRIKHKDGEPLLDESDYLHRQKYLDHTFDSQFTVRRDENEKPVLLADGREEIILNYRIHNNRRGGKFEGEIFTSLSGRQIKATYPNIKVQVMLGILGIAVDGWAIVEYDSFGLPKVAYDEQRRIIKDWTAEGTGVWFDADTEGGVEIRMVAKTARPLALEKRPAGVDPQELVAVGQFDLIETTLDNANFKSERRLGVGKRWGQELIGGWFLVIIPFIVLSVLLALGKIFDWIRTEMMVDRVIREVRREVAQEQADQVPAAQHTNQDDEDSDKNSVSSSATIIEPTYNAYGCDAYGDAVKAAEYRFRGKLGNQVFGGAVTSLLESGVPLAQVASKYLGSFNVWLETIQGEEPLKFEELDERELIEILWISFLVGCTGVYLNNDRLSLEAYLKYKAIKMYREGKGDSIGPFIRKESERWFKINHFASTFYKSFGPMAPSANTVPFQYLFTLEDQEDLFRIPEFVKFYDSLSEEDREILYDKYFIPELSRVSLELKAKAGKLNSRYNNDKKRAKKALVKTPEYKNYIRFLEREWQRKSPLLRKTYSDTIGFQGLGPLKTWMHVYRNLHQPLSIPIQVVFVSLAAALFLRGELTALAITGIILASALLWASKYIITFFLDWGFSKRVNTNAYGKPVRPDEGYQKPKVPSKIRLFRRAFWLTLLSLKGLWNTLVFYYVLTAHYNLWGVVWTPLFGINLNMILIAGLWAPFILFFFLDTFSLYYLMEAIVGYFYARKIGLGHIKTEKGKEALRRILVPASGLNSSGDSSSSPVFSKQKGAQQNPGASSAADVQAAVTEDLLTALFKKTFIPPDLKIEDKDTKQMRPLTKEEKDIAFANIVNIILEIWQDEHMIGQKEYEDNHWNIDQHSYYLYDATITPPANFFSGFKNKKIRERLYRALNGLLMERPDMPLWEKIKILTTMTPVAPGEKIIYSFEELNARKNSGYTELTWIIKDYLDEWGNLIASMIRNGKINKVDLAAMRNVRFGEPLHIIDEDVKMEIRLWASARGQPYYRTLRGKLHYVPILQLYARMNHPEWEKAKVEEEVNKKYQILWGCYYRMLKKGPDGKNMLDLLRYAYDNYGYFVDLTDLAPYDGMNYSILQRYDPDSEEIVDLMKVPLTELFVHANEGKPSNQTHNRRFIRGEVIMTYDINQDYYVEQQLSLPSLMSMFDEDGDIAIIGYPEDIFTDTFSLIGRFHAIADRTFNSLVQRTLCLLGARFHYGHPDLWRAAYVDAFGGVSRSYPVNEDIYGGYQMTLCGKKIVNVEFMEAAKAREVGLGGTDGIMRKFGMGATQQMYGRYIYYLMNSPNFDWTRRLSHIYGGIGYYLRKPIVTSGIFAYLFFMLLLGVSGFAPFTNEILYALLGVIVFAQAITATGYMQVILDKPFLRGTLYFLATFILMSPFFMAHVYTQAFGTSLAMAGVAAYVGTGRGAFLEHVGMDKTLAVFAKSHIVPGFIGTSIAVLAIALWCNPTLIWSAPYIMIVASAMAVPFIANRASLPIFGVDLKTYRKLIKEDFKAATKIISKDLWKAGWKEKAYDKVWDAIIYSIALVAWSAVTFFPFTISVVVAGIATGFSLNGLVVGTLIGGAGVFIVPVLLNIGWEVFDGIVNRGAFTVDSNARQLAQLFNNKMDELIVRDDVLDELRQARDQGITPQTINNFVSTFWDELGDELQSAVYCLNDTTPARDDRAREFLFTTLDNKNKSNQAKILGEELGAKVDELLGQ